MKMLLKSNFVSILPAPEVFLTKAQGQYAYVVIANLLQHLETIVDYSTKVSVIQVVSYIVEQQPKKAFLTVRVIEVLSNLLKQLISSSDSGAEVRPISNNTFF